MLYYTETKLLMLKGIKTGMSSKQHTLLTLQHVSFDLILFLFVSSVEKKYHSFIIAMCIMLKQHTYFFFHVLCYCLA